MSKVTDVEGKGYVYRSDGGWLAKLYGDRRFWGPFPTKRDAVAEVKIQYPG